MSQAGAMNRQGSCARGGGSVKAQTEVQGHWRLWSRRRWSGREQLRQWQSAATELGDSGNGDGGTGSFRASLGGERM